MVYLLIYWRFTIFVLQLKFITIWFIKILNLIKHLIFLFVQIFIWKINFFFIINLNLLNYIFFIYFSSGTFFIIIFIIIFHKWKIVFNLWLLRVFLKNLVNFLHIYWFFYFYYFYFLFLIILNFILKIIL